MAQLLSAQLHQKRLSVHFRTFNTNDSFTDVMTTADTTYIFSEVATTTTTESTTTTTESTTSPAPEPPPVTSGNVIDQVNGFFDDVGQEVKPVADFVGEQSKPLEDFASDFFGRKK